MTSTTSRHAIRRHDDADPLADIGTNTRAAMDRIDLLLGETGSGTIAPSAADTPTSLRVNYARNYAAVGIPKAFVTNDSNTATATTVHWWVSGEDATGFTVNVRASSTSLKSFRWHCRAA